MLKLEQVCKVFGDQPKRALELLDAGKSKDEILEQTGQTLGVVNASFEVEQGEIFVIMGLSGSGKSTLVRLLNRLIEPSRGKILVNGRDIAKMDQEELLELRRREITWRLRYHFLELDELSLSPVELLQDMRSPHQ